METNRKMRDTLIGTNFRHNFSPKTISTCSEKMKIENSHFLACRDSLVKYFFVSNPSLKARQGKLKSLIQSDWESSPQCFDINGRHKKSRLADIFSHKWAEKSERNALGIHREKIVYY